MMSAIVRLEVGVGDDDDDDARTEIEACVQ